MQASGLLGCRAATVLVWPLAWDYFLSLARILWMFFLGGVKWSKTMARPLALTCMNPTAPRPIGLDGVGEWRAPWSGPDGGH